MLQRRAKSKAGVIARAFDRAPSRGNDFFPSARRIVRARGGRERPPVPPRAPHYSCGFPRGVFTAARGWTETPKTVALPARGLYGRGSLRSLPLGERW